jgi:hypothetical protein
MPIVDTDIKFKLSVTTGSAGNTTAQGNVNNSLGKYISTTEITDNTLNNLFDDISGAENAASTVDYRCLFIHNSHASITALTCLLWIQSEVSGGASIAIGLDTNGAVPIGQSSAQAVTIANETTAPSGVTFSTPTSSGTGLSIGSLQPGYCIGVWIRRTAANTSAVNNDGATLGFQCDTTA